MRSALTSVATRVLARQGARIFTVCVTLITLLSVTLTIGQCLRLRHVIFPLDELGRALLAELMWGGVVILCEVAAPIAALISPLLASAHALRSGLSESLESVGRSRAQLLIPSIIVGVMLTGVSMYCAHIQTPATLRALRNGARDISAARWRQLLPHTLAQLLERDVVISALNPLPKREASREASQGGGDWVMWSVKLHATDMQLTGSSHQAGRGHALERVSEYHLWGWSPTREIKISAHWRDQPILSSPTQVSQRYQEDALMSVTLLDVKLSSPRGSLELGELSIPVSASMYQRVERTFGPPNSLDDDELNRESVHHRFILHKRTSAPLSAVWLSILGACWGLRRSTAIRISRSVIALGITFAMLRHLELWARAGGISPEWAAWSPCAILASWALIEAHRLHRGASV